MNRRILILFGCALSAALLSAGAPQTPQQQPVFRSGAVFVNVDAYPRRDGQVVDGLTKGDFEILEDGKPQAVEKFEFVRVGQNTPDAERRDPTSIADAERQAADPHNRVFVIYLDVFHTSLFGSHYTKRPLIDFLSRTIAANDLYGVMTPELPPSHLTFGRRWESLEDALTKSWDWGEAERQGVFPRSDYERKLWACPSNGEGLVMAYREDLTATNLESLMVRLENLRDERKNILFISEGWVPRRAAPLGASTTRRPHIPTIGVGPGGQIGMGANMSGSADAAWCESQAARFAGIDYDLRFKDLLNKAVRANVAFYTVDVGGLKTFSVPASRAPQVGENPLRVAEAYRESGMRRVETLQVLAENTDGKAIVNTNDLVGGVRKISDDLSAYYLLGYYSTNTAADGKFRRIEVKVKAPGVKVSARRGYTAPTEEMRKAEAAAMARPAKEATAVDLELGRLSRLRADAKLYTAVAASPAALDIVVEIAGPEFSGGAWKNGAAVALTLTPKQDGGAALSAEGRIEPGARGVLVNVPLAAGSPGGWKARVRVAAPDGPSLEDDIDVVGPAPASLVGEPIVFRAGTPARSPLRPVADFKFYRTERIHVEWPVTKPLDGRTARLLSRRGDAIAVPVALTERPDGDRIVLAADLSLAPLADGDYVIEISAAGG